MRTNMQSSKYAQHISDTGHAYVTTGSALVVPHEMKNFLYEYPAEISYTQSQQTRNTEE
jgi:hypothetical protein